jgi:hypothetical protein
VEALIDGRYTIDFASKLPLAGGGLPAFAVRDHRHGRTDLMAVQARPDSPPRAHPIHVLAQVPVACVLSPLAHGLARDPVGRSAWFVVSEAPPGLPLLPPQGDSLPRPWSEPDILNLVLRPAAHALEGLQSLHLTHRSIRAGNLFIAANRAGIALGCAWAAPPASLQPAIYEPPYSAMCLPAGRGEGHIADDVYALGVILLILALGRLPMAGMDEATILRRKLEMGSFAALTADERLPPGISDLARGMLAEDPEHRPPPVLLADPAAARARRVAARPPRRAQRPIEIGGSTAWTARTLAFAIAHDPTEGIQMLRRGEIDRWIRRSLGDGLLGSRLDEAVRLRSGALDDPEGRADALLVTRAVAALDPLAPLCWRGLALWPDGFGTALAADDAPADALRDIVAGEAIGAWAGARPERCDFGLLRQEAHQYRTLLRMRGWAGGLPRLRYTLNPLLACRSPLLAGHMAVRPADLLAALEAISGNGAQPGLPIDDEIAAFIAVRGAVGLDHDLAQLGESTVSAAAALAQLRVLATLQERLGAGKLPGLAAWMRDHVTASLTVWRNKQRRELRAALLRDMPATGNLAAMLAVIEDPALRAQDARELERAQHAVHAIDAELDRLATGAQARAEIARRIGQEAAVATGAAGLTIAAVAAVMA